MAFFIDYLINCFNLTYSVALLLYDSLLVSEKEYIRKSQKHAFQLARREVLKLNC